MNLTIVEQIALYFPLMLGAYLSLGLMKIPSLSIESAYVFGAIIASRVVLFDPSKDFFVLVMALFASLCGGAIVGIVAALFSQKAKFSHLLSAIISIGLFHGISQWIVGGTHVTLSSQNNPLRLFQSIPKYPELPIVLCIAILLGILFYLFLKTELGMSCAIYGDNASFLQNYRMNQSYVVIVGLAISNGLVGMSGYMIAQSNGFVDTTMGVGMPLLCISSLIIGKSIYGSDKTLQMMVPFVGVVGYFIIQAILLKLGFDLRYFTTVQAMIVALLLLLVARLRIGASYQEMLGI